MSFPEYYTDDDIVDYDKYVHIKIKGDSLEELDIHEGDIVKVKPYGLSFEENDDDDLYKDDVVLARVNGKSIFGGIQEKGKYVIITPCNKKYEKQMIDQRADVEVLGRLIIKE